MKNNGFEIIISSGWKFIGTCDSSTGPINCYTSDDDRWIKFIWSDGSSAIHKNRG